MNTGKRIYLRASVIYSLIAAAVLLMSVCVVGWAATPWLDSDVSGLIDSPWYKQAGYGDSNKDGCGVWPFSPLDNLFPEPLTGPSAVDSEVIADPSGLYYRHLTPGDLRNSAESLLVGVDGGNCGRTARSLSLMVHPDFELPIVDSIGVTDRVSEFYEPFVEGAIGQSLATADLEPLYRAALYECGAYNGGSTAGLGVNRIFGDYIAVVQWWSGDTMADCNIHVVKLPPTAVEFLSFTATDTRRAVVVDWETANEVGNLGFNLYRSESTRGERTPLNTALIPSLVPRGKPGGAAYSYADETVKRNKTYYYWLEDVDIYGCRELHDPVSTRAR